MRGRRSQCVTAALLCAYSLAAQLGRAQENASSPERHLFQAVNSERQAQGLPALQWDAGLAKAAMGHAREMARQQSMSHQFPGEPGLATRVTKAGVHFRSIAENVAEAPTSATIHDLWMHSPPHRANILDPDMDSIGIAVASRNGQLFAVEDFAKTH